MTLLDTLAGTPELPPTQSVVVTLQSPASTVAVSVVPYNACLDPQADAFLPWMWKRMQQDDLVDYYFPGQKDTGFATFTRLMSGDAEVALFVNEAESKQWDDRITGFITWTPTRMGASDMIIAGFIFFRKFWDHHTTQDAGQVAFAHWFKGTTQVVLGLCPALHIAAMRYNKRVGLREIGRIPLAHTYKGESCDAVLYAMTREEWRARCQQP